MLENPPPEMNEKHSIDGQKKTVVSFYFFAAQAMKVKLSERLLSHG